MYGTARRARRVRCNASSTDDLWPGIVRRRPGDADGGGGVDGGREGDLQRTDVTVPACSVPIRKVEVMHESSRSLGTS